MNEVRNSVECLAKVVQLCSELSVSVPDCGNYRLKVGILYKLSHSVHCAVKTIRMSGSCC